MNTPMTDREVYEYAEKFVSHIDEAGTISKEGVEFLIENVPSLDDQERIINAVKDIKANDNQSNADQERDEGEVAGESPAEDAGQAEAVEPVEA